MTRVEDISVKVFSGDEETGPSPQVVALLHELQGMVDKLAQSDITDSIDIHSLPLTDGELEQLKSLLGAGEVVATVNAMGPTEVTETGIPGVWWLTHYNSQNDILTQAIEVTVIPEILKVQKQDLQQSAALIETRSAGMMTEP